MMYRTIKAHKTEIVEASGKWLYNLIIAMVFSFYLVIVATLVILSASEAKADTNRQAINQVMKNYRGYKCKVMKAENLTDAELASRKGKNIVYIEYYKTVSFGKYGKVTTKGVFHGKRINYAKPMKRGKKVTVYLVYNPKTNYTDDVITIINNGWILN